MQTIVTLDENDLREAVSMYVMRKLGYGEAQAIDFSITEPQEARDSRVVQATVELKPKRENLTVYRGGEG